MESAKSEPEYRCPGENYPIDRPVHLARMAAYYPLCRRCSHNCDTDGLPSRLLRRLHETWERMPATAEGGSTPSSLFYAEGAAGVYLNEIGPVEVRKIAAAFGIALRESLPHDNSPLKKCATAGLSSSECGKTRENTAGQASSGTRNSQRRLFQRADKPDSPTVIVAGDGRAITPELVAAAAEGLRWSGCNVVDVGNATAPCTAFAVAHLQADGGIMVGNPGRKPHIAGLKFWSAGGHPLSLGDGEHLLDEVRRIYAAGPQRPCRRYGCLQRLQVEADYLATLAGRYHALRPLRVLLDCACQPLVDYLQRLTEPTACEVLLRRNTETGFRDYVRKIKPHLALTIDGYGETCTLYDERGEIVDADRLLEKIDRHALSQTAADGAPSLDAIMTITLVLEILSQSDRPLSSVFST